MRKGKRPVMLILSAFLIISLLVGCDVVRITSTEATTSKPAGADETPAATEDKIIWSGKITVAPYMFGPVDKNKDVIKPLLEEKLLQYGYDVELENVYIENIDYEELLGVRINANNAPDIFEPKSSSTMRTYFDQGAIASWDKEFFIEHCPYINSFVESGCVDGRLKDYVDMFWEFAMIGDRMVTVPPMSEAGTALPKVMLFRKDWLDNLGVTELPYTLDDFLALMYRFKNEDPDRNGKDDTYSFSTSVIRAIFGAFDGYTSFPDPKAENRIEFYYRDGKVICGDVLPTNKQALEILAKCYADGLIDPEFVAQNGENQTGYWALSQPFINGRIGASCHAGIGHYYPKEVMNGKQEGQCLIEYHAVNGEDAEVVFAPWPAGPEGNFGGWSLGPASGIGENAVYNSALNKDPEKLGALLSIMDICSKDDEIAMLCGGGIEGVHYEYDATGGMVRLMTNEELNAIGVWAYRGVYGGPNPFNAKLMKATYYNAPVTKYTLEIQAKPGYKGGYNRDVYDTTPSTATYKSELIAYRDETFIKMIRGEMSVDEYDNYVKEYLKRGGEILTKEAQDWWDERH